MPGQALLYNVPNLLPAQRCLRRGRRTASGRRAVEAEDPEAPGRDARPKTSAGRTGKCHGHFIEVYY